MASERITEELVLNEMDFEIGKNKFGNAFAQSDAVQFSENLKKALERAGGKPKVCEIDNYELGGYGIGKPEFIITFDKDKDTVLVVECKASIKKHASAELNQPNAYAVDGVLYYAKFIKDYYNVIAIAVSGSPENYKVSTYDWRKNQDKPSELKKGRDVLYSPENYLKMLRGENVVKKISIEEIRQLALLMHNNLRVLKMTEKDKPVFIAGILIALKDNDFSNNYQNQNSFRALLAQLKDAIRTVLENSDIRQDKINDIKSHFERIGRNGTMKEIPLGQDNSLLWYISELDRKIKPMMDYTGDKTVDALGIFYHEFVKYSGGDGSGLGIVLTPQHLTEFMVDLAGVDKNSKVVDICCGSAAFLVTAMSKMFKNANEKEIAKIKSEGLYGVEFEDGIYTLAIANMIVRGDGKSNIRFGDCFKPEIINWLKEKHINVGLINPPYSQKDHCELEFVENMLDILTVGGTGVVVVPMSCAIGTKFKDVRERLFEKHTLKAVFSMPDDIFYSNNANTNVCVMVWQAHKPHDSTKQTFFGYYKDDGFVKAKKLGRIDKFNRWEGIKKEWLDLYENLDVKDGLTAKKAVNWNDEWLCEAYMETDYSKLTQNDFQQTVNNFLAYKVKFDV